MTTSLTVKGESKREDLDDLALSPIFPLFSISGGHRRGFRG
jgi:hypothetical protein